MTVIFDSFLGLYFVKIKVEKAVKIIVETQKQNNKNSSKNFKEDDNLSTEKIKRFLENKKALIASGIALVLIVSTIFTFSFMITGSTKAVALVVDGEKDVYQTEAITVQGFLDEQDIDVKPQDEVSVDLYSFIEDRQTIEINTAVEMTVIDGGETFKVIAQPGTVEEVLNATGHARGANDWVSPSLQSQVGEGAVITVDRITYAQETLTEVVEPQVIEKDDNSMPAGTTKVLQEGVSGVDSVVYESIYKNGNKITDVEISRTTVQPSEDKIVAVGTKSAEAHAAGVTSYSKCLTVSATAYTHTGNRTATGTIARVGVIAVDPSVIPLGTKVYVEGYGFATAEDTGGAIKGNRIDIFLNSNSECINWGRRNVKVYILD
jgi:3D (Asp-Asp-Asp) domain-containing protein